jgi:hypothetical protein
MHPAGPTFESSSKKPRFYLSHTYLVENVLYSPNPGSSRITDNPEVNWRNQAWLLKNPLF